MSKKVKILLFSSLLILACVLLTTLVLPVLARSKFVSLLEAETGRKVHLEKITINPFTLSVGIKGFAIDARDGGRFIAIDMVRTSLSTASLFRMALVLDEVTVESPVVQFARISANTYNFSDIIELQKSKSKTSTPKKTNGSPQFSINNIHLNNGTILFDDRAVSGTRKHTVRNLNIAVPFIGNIPYLVDKYSDPHISAIINDSPFSFSGKVKPFSTSRETSVTLDLQKYNLTELLKYVPVKPNFAITSGYLSVALEVSYQVSSTKKPELNIKGTAGLNSVVLDYKDGRPLVRLSDLTAKAANLEIFARRYLFDSIIFDGLELFVSRNEKSVWNFNDLVPPADKKPTADSAVPEAAVAPAQPLVQVGTFSINNSTLHFRDMVPKGGYTNDISRIVVKIANFTTAPDKTADYQLSLLLNNEAPLQATGTFSLEPLIATVSLDVKRLMFKSRWPYLATFLTAPVTGTVNVSTKASYSKRDGLVVEQGHLSVTDLATRYGDAENFRLSRFEVKGAGYNQKDKKIEIGEIAFLKGDLPLSREPDGSLSLLSLFTSHQKKSDSIPAQALSSLHAQGEAARPVVSPREGQKSSGLSYLIRKVTVAGLNASFTDKTNPGKPHFTLTDTKLNLANLNGPKFTPSALDFKSTFNKVTPLRIQGSLTPQPFAFKGNVDIGHVPLRDFEAYIPSNIKVFLLAGTADTTMDLDFALKNGKPTGSFSGTAGLRSFHAVDMVAENDLMKWESLQLDGIQGTFEPFTLSLKEIALNNCYTRVIVRKDGTLNFQNLVKQPDTPFTQAALPAVSTQQTAPPARMKPGTVTPQIRIGAVTVQDATLSFNDKHLAQQFSTTFYKLGGRISGLSSESTQFADVDLRGNLENNSPLQITGKINPLCGDLFMDLKISFRDIDLTPITPYTAQFLGYAVEKGKLTLDLSYNIDKKQLVSKNSIFIDQFTLGEKVKNETATKLPVKLGLALIKDSQGEIHLDVPVNGRTDDPKLNVWSITFHALQNLLVKAVTSPFSFFASMFHDSKNISVVPFEPGLSTVPTTEAQKLGAFAKILHDRPALKLELRGYVNKDTDSEAYRLELFKRKVSKEKFLAMSKAGTLKPGENAATTVVHENEFTTYLAVAYKKADFPKPRDSFGAVKELPPEEMQKLILTNTLVGESELQALARERVVAIKDYLVSKGNVSAERIYLMNDNIHKEPEKEIAAKSRVEFTAAAL